MSAYVAPGAPADRLERMARRAGRAALHGAIAVAWFVYGALWSWVVLLGAVFAAAAIAPFWW